MGRGFPRNSPRFMPGWAAGPYDRRSGSLTAFSPQGLDGIVVHIAAAQLHHTALSMSWAKDSLSSASVRPAALARS